VRREVADLHKNNVRLRFIGERECLDSKLNEKISNAEALTADNTGLRLQVAVAYGGRWDIVEAARSVASKVVSGEISPESIDEATFAAELQLGGAPDPDLLIRTGGEQRISNFLLWNLAYAELWFTDVLWPDFGQAEFEAALAYYSAGAVRIARGGGAGGHCARDTGRRLGVVRFPGIPFDANSGDVRGSRCRADGPRYLVGTANQRPAVPGGPCVVGWRACVDTVLSDTDSRRPALGRRGAGAGAALHRPHCPLPRKPGRPGSTPPSLSFTSQARPSCSAPW
jgi:hypothetical protein